MLSRPLAQHLPYIIITPSTSSCRGHLGSRMKCLCYEKCDGVGAETPPHIVCCPRSNLPAPCPLSLCWHHRHAFFPGYPGAIRILATAVTRVLPEGLAVPFDEALIIAAVMVSNVAFVVAAVGLYMLSIIVLGSEHRAFCSALLFCVNPASVFMSTAYSESLYAAVTFWGLWAVVQCWPSVRSASQCSIPADGIHGNAYVFNTVLGTMLLAFASSTRSIGVINSVISAWIVVLYAVRSLGLAAEKGHNTKPGVQQAYKDGATHRSFVGSVCSMSTVVALSSAMMHVAASMLPPLLFDWYGRAHLCLTPSNPPAWCATTATVYDHVQRTYWNVGPLQYWRIKQLPNFALATPAAALCGHCMVAHVRHAFTRPRPLVAALSPSAWGGRSQVLPFSALPFVAVWAAVTMFGIVVINVQVCKSLHVRGACSLTTRITWHLHLYNHL